MKLTIHFLIICLFSTACSQTQALKKNSETLTSYNKPYLIYKSDGTLSSYEEMLNETSQASFVFFGELHDNPMSHWLQLQLTKAYFKTKGSNLVLGAEMFEADDQLILNEYLDSVITHSNFIKEAKLWDNYKTDYKPLLDFALHNKLKFIATNVPRRYANLVYKKDIESLSTLDEDAKKFMAPLPFKIDLEVKGYKDMIVMMGDHGSPKIAKAQMLKDATMSHFILKNYKKGNLFLHFNGSYHSKNKEGIIYYLKQTNNDEVKTITTVLQKNVNKLEDKYIDEADFIVVVPDDMTRTY